MAERGVDLQTEHKVEQWRRDVAAEIHHLQNQFKLQRLKDDDEDSSNLSQVAALFRDIHDL